MLEPNSPAELLAIPYHRRQLIVIVDDAVAKKLASETSRPNGTPDVWQMVLKAAAAGALGPLLWAPSLIEVVIRAVQGLKERGIEVMTVGTTAASALTFPPGHPRGNVLYVGHPAKSNVYYTAAHFHRVTFEHKFSEAIRILMCLGALDIKVEFVRGWKEDFASQLSVPLAPTQSVSASGSTGAASRDNLLFRASFSANRPPNVPNDLIWYHHEPTWQNVVEGRLQHGLRDFSLTISYEDDFGINIGLKGLAQNAGLELGGKFQDHQNTVWQIVGKFAGDES